MSSLAEQEAALKQKDIRPGDVVEVDYANYKREGEVTKIANDVHEHPRPPKVIFKDHDHGDKEVAYNPTTVKKVANREYMEQEGSS